MSFPWHFIFYLMIQCRLFCRIFPPNLPLTRHWWWQAIEWKRYYFAFDFVCWWNQCNVKCYNFQACLFWQNEQSKKKSAKTNKRQPCWACAHAIWINFIKLTWTPHSVEVSWFNGEKSRLSNAFFHLTLPFSLFCLNWTTENGTDWKKCMHILWSMLLFILK